MNKKLGNIIAIIFVISLGVWGLFDTISKQSSSDATSSSGAEIGTEANQQAPDFTLTNLDGEEVSLSDYKGKKVLINFWATWCPPCKAEMPHMEEFYENYKDQGIEILAINLTGQEGSIGDVEKFVSDYKLTFPILLDEKASVANMFQPKYIPTSFVIDEEGFVEQRYDGGMTYETIKHLMSVE